MGDRYQAGHSQKVHAPRGGTGPLKWTVLWFVGRVGSGRLVADIWLPRAVGGAQQIHSEFGFPQRWGFIFRSGVLWHRAVYRSYQRCVLARMETVLLTALRAAYCRNTVSVIEPINCIQYSPFSEADSSLPAGEIDKIFTAFARARHLSLSCASLIQSIIPSFLM